MKSIHKQDGFRDEKLIIIPEDFFSGCKDHPLVSPLYVTDVGYFPEALHHHRERQNGIDENILLYCIDGEGSIRIPGELITLKKGELFCIPSNTGHIYHANKNRPWSILWVHFKGSNTPLYPIADKRVIRLTTTSENNVLQYLFTLLIDTLEHDYILGNYIYASQVTSLILSEIYLKEKSSEMDRLNHKLTRVIRYMISNLSEELTLDQISEDMEISKSYLNSIFKKYTSHSPMDYFIHLRIQQACKYLKMTNMRIYEVSSKLGYRDPCYFSRLFKQVVGLSPREYKRQNETVMITDDDLLTAAKR